LGPEAGAVQQSFRTMSPSPTEWLLVIDMQRAFADPPSPWAADDFYSILPRIERLIAGYDGRVVLTRYVPPTPLTGAWIGYYAMFPSLLLPENDPAWNLKVAAGGLRVETRATFSKWDAAMAAVVGPESGVAVCGVATECCVLGTVLAAVDHGRSVRVFTDACAGGTLAAHEQTIAVLNGFAPLVTLTTTAEQT
jgi:nicotinamidase-related amidase